MTLSMELMDWVKLIMIVGTLTGNGAWIYYSVKNLKEELSATNARIDEYQRSVEKRFSEFENQIRYEISEKVDKRQYYDDLGGWKADIRELRATITEIFKQFIETFKEMRK
ncbi:hypothetical protein SAMN06269117_1298 [Balnearium lithotrophicum]|uniref:Uncharacterized protein n=1 Tax=Balnearium lithotrophicum TaxID=223788 RepID=A0A521E1K6_9BACT|nr:hypothetical protein [Balnearium lithotrophicum]SMO77191.1 hypothetical protein SAMN06269117_1298 [Balnearium lithotrophicum]